MKIKTKDIKECEFTNGKQTLVLDLLYTHRGLEGRILVKDYDDKNYEGILKQLRKEVRQAYKEWKLDRRK